MTDLSWAYVGMSIDGKDIIIMALRGKVAELMVMTAPNIYRR